MNSFRSRYGTAGSRPYARRPSDARLPPVFRFARGEAVEEAAADPLAREPALARLEAVLLLADEPLAARRLAEAAGLASAAEARTLIARLRELLVVDGSAFEIEELAGGYQLLTGSRYHPWLSRLKRTGHELRLTPAVMETLAILAYRQPIMRADVDKIRGVSSSEIIRQLMEKGLVKVVGRHDSLGRPQLYGTTRKFLQAFGLNSLADLPEVEALKVGNRQ